MLSACVELWPIPHDGKTFHVHVHVYLLSQKIHVCKYSCNFNELVVYNDDVHVSVG